MIGSAFGPSYGSTQVLEESQTHLTVGGQSSGGGGSEFDTCITENEACNQSLQCPTGETTPEVCADSVYNDPTGTHNKKCEEDAYSSRSCTLLIPEGTCSRHRQCSTTTVDEIKYCIPNNGVVKVIIKGKNAVGDDCP